MCVQFINSENTGNEIMFCINVYFNSLKNKPFKTSENYRNMRHI